MDSICLTVSPPALVTWLSDQEQSRSVVLLDFHPDVVSAGCVRLNLNVGFNAVKLRQRGKRAALADVSSHAADWYIGTTSAEVTVIAHNGVVQSYTSASTLAVNYKESVELGRACKVTLEPKIAANAARAETEVSLGSVVLEGDRSSVLEVTLALLKARRRAG